MAEAVLSVMQAGPLVTVQDGGRPGLMRFGVPRSGPMDRRAFAIANAALGNALDAPSIEVSIGGVSLSCLEGELAVAVAGGGFRVHGDGGTTPSWTVRRLRSGSTLTVQPGFWGSWTYIAFGGEMSCPRWLGSASTHVVAGRGGGSLQVGQHLSIDTAGVRHRLGAIPLPVSARPRHGLRVVPGPQERFFPPAALEALVSRPFMVTTAYDRMGVRLQGPSLAPDRPLTMPSEPLLRGALQVAGDGVATVLLADHQTTGGYPKIATLVADDVDALVQLRPREPVAFRPVSPQAAVAAASTRQGRWLATLGALDRWRREEAAGVPDEHG